MRLHTVGTDNIAGTLRTGVRKTAQPERVSTGESK